MLFLLAPLNERNFKAQESTASITVPSKDAKTFAS